MYVFYEKTTVIQIKERNCNHKFIVRQIGMGKIGNYFAINKTDFAGQSIKAVGIILFSYKISSNLFHVFVPFFKDLSLTLL